MKPEQKPHLPEDFSPTDAVYNLQFPTSVLCNDQPGQFPIGKLQKLVICVGMIRSRVVFH